MRLHRGLRPFVICIALALLGCSVVDPRVEKRWARIRGAAIPLDDDGIGPKVPPVLPVVFLPGSKGSILRQPNCDGKTLWGNTRVLVLSKLDDLTIPLPKDETFSADRFDQRIQPCGILGGVEVLPSSLPFLQPFEYPIYRGFTEILEEAGGFVRDQSIFYFDYDWRLDNRISAVELAAVLGAYRRAYYKHYLAGTYCKAWQPVTDLPRCVATIQLKWPHLFSLGGEIKFNFVTHSMGGLVAQYFIRGLGYGGEVNSLVLIASPSEGAMFPLEIMMVGEYALGDTVLHFYQKKETRPIGLSFPSAFQALPRYEDAVKPDPRSRAAYTLQYAQGDLGLTEEMPVDQDAQKQWARQVAANWVSMLDLDDPSWGLICRISRAPHPSEECRDRIRLHLQREIPSSVSFQKTTHNSFCGTQRERQQEQEALQARQEFERKRVAEAKEILKKIRPPRAGMERREWMDAIEAVEHRACPPRRGREAVHERLPRHIYQWFGHCDSTPTFALTYREGGRDRLHFCEGEDPESDACHDLGDKRIPRVSMDALARQGGSLSDFVLCVDHIEVVKNLIVQDNLLRILFRERLEPVPAR